MTKAQIEGAAKPAPKAKPAAAKPAALGDVLTAFIEAHPDKWEEMRLWPAQSAIPEIVKLSK